MPSSWPHTEELVRRAFAYIEHHGVDTAWHGPGGARSFRPTTRLGKFVLSRQQTKELTIRLDHSHTFADPVLYTDAKGKAAFVDEKLAEVVLALLRSAQVLDDLADA